MAAEKTEGRIDPEHGLISKLLCEPELIRLLCYWRDKRAGRPMPAREDIDPLELPWALSRLSLLDYNPDTGFRYRLAGGEVSQVFGRGNLKGLGFRDLLSPKGADFVEERWLPTVTQRSICCMKGMVYLAAERTPIGERIVLPLADDSAGPVTSVLAMTVCQWLDGEVAPAAKLSQVEYIPVDDIP